MTPELETMLRKLRELHPARGEELLNLLTRAVSTCVIVEQVAHTCKHDYPLFHPHSSEWYKALRAAQTLRWHLQIACYFDGLLDLKNSSLF